VCATLFPSLATTTRAVPGMRVTTDLVQKGGAAEMFLIDMDTLSIEQDSIPDTGRSGIVDAEIGEIELPLANAMQQLDT